ncbi:putative HAF family extracellular repeat protein [Allocatelliglobosispora scoriae]|uniref:Putative HAF family extracellular repeat protein n=1 Tax=Allocatelliglobosispora scoriae TaxID=643052 RepID=A0A841C0Z8_9ACTN|nr:hypothetical protein [Allocatelliglobosispora scoriae]MBB5873536.1 putative HAF family extracellular repeat protein [Allocatelliglobosispora scoriae]
MLRLIRPTLAAALVAAALPVLAASPAAAAFPSRYTITDLGTLGTASFAQSTALGINNAGTVVGVTSVGSGYASHAFRWASGVMTDLGTNPGGDSSYATSINDTGTVAGVSDRQSGGYGYPVRWSASGAITDLGGPVVNRLGVANGINASGQIAGGQRPADSSGSPVAMVYNPDGSSVLLGSPPESLGAATGINALGHAVGSPGFLWHDGVLESLPGLRYYSGDLVTATAINVRDQIVGAAPIGDYATHATLWPGADLAQTPVATDIGTIDGIAYSTAKAINASGQVVGTVDPMCQPCPAPRAWVWQAGSTITALDTLIPAGTGWTLQQANGINDRGQIVGRGLVNGKYHAYLLTPRFAATVNFQPASAAVPTGYLADTGAVFGARTGGLSYGWTSDDTAFTRDRNSVRAADQRYDTLIHSQHPTSANAWEIAVPNGTYLVHVASGDPDYTDSVHRIAVEGVLTVSGTPTSTARWVERSVIVTVTDGRLTIGNATGGSNNKLSYVDIVNL